MRHPDRFFAPTIRLRTEGTDHLLAAAEAAGVAHVVAQSFGAFNGIREGGWVKTEQDPLDPGPAGARRGTEALRHLEDAVIAAGGAALRYGSFYGPGASDDQVQLVRKRMFPLVGGGTGYLSWVHLDDAASATVLALEQQAKGVFNIADDEPAPASQWLPYLAECAGAKPPRRLPAGLARLLAGDMVVVMMTQGRGFCNAKAKRELVGRCATRRGGKGSRKRSRESGRGVRGAPAAAVRRSPTGSGPRGEAEDAVQETWLRYQGSAAQPASAKAFLAATVTRISIDVLRSARVRREQYAGPGPRAAADRPVPDPERSAELADSVSMAALLLLERLSPLERAVFVLREVFGFAFPRSRRRWGARRPRAASSQSGPGATWTPGGPGSRPAAGNATSWRHGSSARSGTATSGVCGNCSRLTSS